MYNIQQFSKMTGVSPSSLRFYEKKGLFNISRTDGNYREYAYQDAFVVNKLKTYLEFGFSVNDAIDFIHHKKEINYGALIEQRIHELTKEEFIVTRRKKKLVDLYEKIELLKKQKYIIQTVGRKAFCCVHASDKNDFSVSNQNKEALFAYVDLLPVSDYAVIWNQGKLEHYSLMLRKEDAEIFNLVEGAECICADTFIEMICYGVNPQKMREVILNYALENHYTLTGKCIEIPSFIEPQHDQECICYYYLPIK